MDDDSVSLYYLKSRHYHPALCRFLQADTVLGKLGAIGTHNLYAYCKNNPVNREDQSGHISITYILGALSQLKQSIVGFMRTKVLPAYLSYAQRVDDAQNRLIRSYWNTCEKIVQSGAAIFNSISVEAGVGTGLGGSVSVGIVSVSSQYKNDYVNYSGNIGNTKLGNVQQLSLELSLGLPGVDELSKSVSITGTYYHPFNAANCTCDGAWNYLASCPAVEYTYSENDTLSLGASVYLGVGGTIQVSIDSANMWNELRTIWN